MKKVEAILRVIREPDKTFTLMMKGRTSVLNQVLHYFVSNRNEDNFEYIDLSCVITKIAAFKTKPQLGYWHGEILPKAVIGYERSGYRNVSNGQAETWLKEMFFFEENTNELTGEIKKTPRSFEGATKEEMSEVIDQSILFIQEELGIEVETPEDYKKRMERLSKI